MTQAWESVRLEQVLIERRETPKAQDLVSGTVKVVSKISFSDGLIQIRQSSDTKTGMILAYPGDILVSGINASKGAIAIYDPNASSPIAATIHYGAYTPIESRVDRSFLWWLLRSKTFGDLLQQYVPGGIKTELKAKRFLPIPIPLPPLEEQRRIVARVESLAAQIAEARGLREQAQNGCKVLTSALITKVLTSSTITGFLSDVMLSKPRNGWSVIRNNESGGVPILSLGAVTGFKYKGSEFKRTSESTNPESHYWLQAGDLLMTRSNTPDLVGHAAIYDGIPSPCIYPDLMMRLDLDPDKTTPRFVHWWLQASITREYIKQNAKGTSPTMKKITQGVVMKIPFPKDISLQDQDLIIKKLETIELSISALEQLQEATRLELNALLPSVLSKAFAGEL